MRFTILAYKCAIVLTVQKYEFNTYPTKKVDGCEVIKIEVHRLRRRTSEIIGRKTIYNRLANNEF